MNWDELQKYLDKKSQEIGFSHWGMTDLRAGSLHRYKKWLDQEMHGEMSYLERHYPIKENPQRLYPEMQSALVFAHSYLPHPYPDQAIPKKLRIAQYAKGKDYHFWLREKLQLIVEDLKLKYPEAHFFTATDSSPLLERDLAYRAGMGWFGKNTCLIHPKEGSFFLIGEILTSLNLPKISQELPDFCGKCNACIEICPTQALKPRELDARKCISYLTIESKKNPELELRSGIGDWLFGCDLCQAVCPWNQKKYKTQVIDILKSQLSPIDQEIRNRELKKILTSSNKALAKDYKSTALERASGFGLKRNALIVIANQKILALRGEVEKLQEDEKLGELARWALDCLETRSPFNAQK